jgi:hypothetical protein
MKDWQGWPPSPGVLDALLPNNPRFVGVVDADVILPSVENDCVYGRRSRLLRAAEAGTGLFFSSDHVYDELYRRLPRFAARGLVSLDRLRQRLEGSYLQHIRFVSVPPELFSLDPQVAAVRTLHADDVATAALAKLIAPCIVFSADKHLRKPGVAAPEWRQVAGAGADVSRGDLMLASTCIAVMAPPAAAVALVRGLARSMDVPVAIAAAAIAAAGAFLLRDQSRRLYLGEKVGSSVKALGAALADAHGKQQVGLARLREATISQPIDALLEQRIASTLVRARRPLLAREVHAAVEETSSATLAGVRSVLSSQPMFESVGHRWQLGHRSEPLDGGDGAR